MVIDELTSTMAEDNNNKNNNNKGSRSVNEWINKLPYELHIPGYKFCGPGTRLKEKLANGETGINPLDSACLEHDKAYEENPDNLHERHKADNELSEAASERVFALDAQPLERLTGYYISKIMDLKTKWGFGIFDKNFSKKKKTILKKKKK